MTDDQLLRYARHLMLQGFGVEGQERLLRGHALVVGAGGLGSPVALYLASAGVARITLIDDDVVELANLQRQIAHATARLGLHKVDSAAQAMRELNPDVEVAALRERADARNLPAWVALADVVLDCSDNFATRQAVNAECVRQGKPLVWASAQAMDGQLGAYEPATGQGAAASACYACVFPPDSPPPEVACATLGVLAPLVGVMGSLQAAEAVKRLAGMEGGGSLRDRLLMLDARTMSWSDLRVTRQPRCPVCGDGCGS